MGEWRDGGNVANKRGGGGRGVWGEERMKGEEKRGEERRKKEGKRKGDERRMKDERSEVRGED